MGIRPWEVGMLTVEEFDLACKGIDEYIRQMKEVKS